MQAIYSFFGYPLGWVFWLCYQIFNNYGISLILFTVILKLLLFPLSIKQQKSSAKMAIYQPRLTEIQKKYKNDKKKQQEELMNFYEEEHYNPSSGCLPTLIQFPILFGLIDVIYRPITHLLRIPSDIIEKCTPIAREVLTAKFPSSAPEIGIIRAVGADSSKFASVGAEYIDKIKSVDLNFLGMDLSQTPSIAWNLLLIIPILSFITAILLSLVSLRTNPAYNPNTAGSGALKTSMLIMPLFSLFIAFQVPAGVGFYWMLTNILSIAQSFVLFKLYHPDKLKAQIEEERQQRKEASKKILKQVEVKNKNGDAVVFDKEMSEKEINRLRLAKARQLDALKYGEEYIEDEVLQEKAKSKKNK